MSRRGGDAEAVGDILSRVMRDVRPQGRRRRDGLLEAWETACGAEIAKETRPATLRGGVLTVDVRGAGLLHELQSFRRDELRRRLLEADPTGRVSDLRFQLGVF